MWLGQLLKDYKAKYRSGDMHDVEPHVNHFMRIGEEQKHAHHKQTNFKQGNIVERRVQVALKRKVLLSLERNLRGQARLWLRDLSRLSIASRALQSAGRPLPVSSQPPKLVWWAREDFLIFSISNLPDKSLWCVSASNLRSHHEQRWVCSSLILGLAELFVSMLIITMLISLVLLRLMRIVLVIGPVLHRHIVLRHFKFAI